MPDLDGLEVLARLRGGGSEVPVCILSARDEVDDRVRGLQAGADDYVVKPFAMEEGSARLQALLRRRPAGGGEAGVVGALRGGPPAPPGGRGGGGAGAGPRPSSSGRCGSTPGRGRRGWASASSS